MLLVVSIASIALLASGCGLRDPYRDQEQSGTTAAQSPAVTTTPAKNATQTATAAESSTPTTMEPSPSKSSQVSPGTADGPRGVVDKFAIAYSEFAAVSMRRRLDAMCALATRASASSLRRSAAAADRESRPGLPPGGRMAARVTGLALEPSQGVFDHGLVTVTLVMTLANGTAEQPFTSTYEVDLLRIDGVWRVADFEAQP